MYYNMKASKIEFPVFKEPQYLLGKPWWKISAPPNRNHSKIIKLHYWIRLADWPGYPPGCYFQSVHSFPPHSSYSAVKWFPYKYLNIFFRFFIIRVSVCVSCLPPEIFEQFLHHFVTIGVVFLLELMIISSSRIPPAILPEPGRKL